MLAFLTLLFLRTMPIELSIILTRMLIHLYLFSSKKAREQLFLVREKLTDLTYTNKAFVNQLAVNLCLMMRMGTALSKKLGKTAKIEGIGNLERVKQSQTSAVVVTYHFGPWELLPEVFTIRGYKVAVLAGVQKMKIFGKSLGALRKRCGMQIVRSFDEAAAILNTGSFLAGFLDKTRRSKELLLDVPFKGYKSSKIPLLVAKRNKKAVLPVVCRFINHKLVVSIGKANENLSGFFTPFFKQNPNQWLLWGS